MKNLLIKIKSEIELWSKIKLNLEYCVDRDEILINKCVGRIYGLEHIRELMEQDLSESIYIRWDISDVRDSERSLYGKQLLSEDQCLEVLENCLFRHDANHGINWNIIESQIEIIVLKYNLDEK